MIPTPLQPISRFPVLSGKKPFYFFMDIDDTFTTDGLITAAAFNALWRLANAGVRVIPVTGRPAGWCDHIARMWPVDAIIGENGAFYFSYNRDNRKMIRHFFQTAADRSEGKSRLKTLRERVIEDVPGCAISADQPFRIADLAVDFCEDVPPLSRDAIDQICAIARELGLTCKVSSIHVNCWFGRFDKLVSLRQFLAIHCGSDLDRMQHRIAFIGDSPNDEPMFASIHLSIAVANIRDFLDQMVHHPAYVTQRSSGEGFVEAVDIVLSKL